MDLDKSKIRSVARSFGVDDVAYVTAENTKGSCVIVLFCRYFAARSPQKGNISVSPYYVASNTGYHAAKKLTAYLISAGAYAEHSTSLNAKTTALKSGGHMGSNGFYYHPELGSLVSIHTIITDCVLPDEPPQNNGVCLNCDACKKACPSDAVGDLQNCLRYHINGVVPKHLREDLYQLFGCERCQTACPLNSAEQRQAPAYNIDELLDGKHLVEIKSFVGKNMARANRLLSQTAIFAANAKHQKALGQLNALSAISPSLVCEHALWAALQLGGTHD